ncbi:YqhA family protein [Eudoraea chungangensis]|uniref:YqhA family protein n=1 Tax=Eudoraea chungangensis TaxID=1481905 RepID=UPI0023EBDFC8|nr:YqhA family protein [Eudoraea chungangensis]
MIHKVTPFRYIYLIAVIVTLVNSIFFLITGVALSIESYKRFIKVEFVDLEESYPGLYMLEALDAFMLSLVFMIFGIGVARIFIFDKYDGHNLPNWLNISSLSELKILLWRTILFALVMFSVTHLVKHPIDSWKVLLLPTVVLILSAALFLIHKRE